jgi:hypothetical protein
MSFVLSNATVVAARQVKSSNLQASSRFRARSVFHKRERSTWLQIPCPSKGQLLYCKETFRFYQKVLRNLFLPNARVESDYNIMAKRKGTKRQTVVYKTLCTEN